MDKVLGKSVYEDFGLAKSNRTTRQMDKNQHYKLTRIFILFLVTLFFLGNRGILARMSGRLL